MLLDVVIALAPVVLAALVFHPLDALRSLLLSIATMELAEFLFV
ncbi:MAG: electron transporter RnfD, partial [Bacilli bacterium]|nr:electron transporter RnfD [Bacilli bacterium]